jgi:hypothetical protein
MIGILPATSASSPSGDDPIPTDVAEYIADVLAELRTMAAASGHHPLTEILDVARREALREDGRAA